jgi:polyribonucleotide nucleotidyltransferase
MSKTLIKKELSWGGRTLSVETGKMANQADASILARYGDTVVLATVVAQPAKEDISFFPLAVDYEERLYASGRISSSRFIKREGRPTEEAILTGRLVDRSVRPLFPKDYMEEVQVVMTVLSYDNENDPDILSIVAASAVLSMSDIPWKGPLAAAKVGLTEGEFILNPTQTQMAASELELVVSASKDRVVMLEAGAKEVSEEMMIKAIKFAQEQATPVIEMINDFVKEVGTKKKDYESALAPSEVKDTIVKHIKDNFKDQIFHSDRAEREKRWQEFRESLYVDFEGKLTKVEMSDIFDDTVKKMVRHAIVDEKKRPDGRKMDEVRELEVEVGLLPRTHGSGLFRRGDTQVLNIATLGSTSLEQLIDGMQGEATKRFMHHYTFPPYSTGEVRRLGSPGRREIGHGALAERALAPVIPSTEDFPYTIRLVSEVLSSSGSTSMGATCSSTLSLMDAGVPIKAPVSGIAMGLVTEEDKYEILTDIQALEDFFGDMDFKIAGTEKGITAIQMDTKIEGLTDEMIEKTFKDGKVARDFILKKMLSVIDAPRKELSEHAPKVTVIHIPPKKIGEVIGTGGKVINKIIEETGVAIDIDDDGTVMISGTDPVGAEKAKQWIEGITHEPKPGEVYDGTVKRLMNFGAFVEILPGKEGLVHISQIAEHRVEDITKEVKVGQKMKVKVTEIDSQGRLNLTAKNVE